MTRKPFRFAMVLFVACALIAPLGGCSDEAQTKPSIDVSTPIKAPGAPTAQKVEQLKKKG